MAGGADCSFGCSIDISACLMKTGVRNRMSNTKNSFGKGGKGEGKEEVMDIETEEFKVPNSKEIKRKTRRKKFSLNDSKTSDSEQSDAAVSSKGGKRSRVNASSESDSDVDRSSSVKRSKNDKARKVKDISQEEKLTTKGIPEYAQQHISCIRKVIRGNDDAEDSLDALVTLIFQLTGSLSKIEGKLEERKSKVSTAPSLQQLLQVCLPRNSNKNYLLLSN